MYEQYTYTPLKTQVSRVIRCGIGIYTGRAGGKETDDGSKCTVDKRRDINTTLTYAPYCAKKCIPVTPVTPVAPVAPKNE